MRRSTLWLCAVALAATWAPTASASPIVSNQWYAFCFGSVGSALSGGSGGCVSNGVDPPSILAPTPAWTITLPTGGELIVTDAFLPGDRFELSNNGVTLGDTSVPTTHGTTCTNDITACLTDSDFSSGIFVLPAGFDTITGVALVSPFVSGGAYFEVTQAAQPMPETASLASFIAGLIGLAFTRRFGRVFFGNTL
jgi:hypothetical protein